MPRATQEIGSSAIRMSSPVAFEMTVSGWPFYFKDMVTRWSTRKRVAQLGWVPTTDRRDAVYDTLLRDWFDNYDRDDYPEIPDEWILREAAGAVVGKTSQGSARCDHPSSGSIDSLTAFGILLYVFKNHNRQVKCNGGEEVEHRRPSWLEMAMANLSPKPPVFLGEGIPSFR